jgi:hypothetical protein
MMSAISVRKSGMKLNTPVRCELALYRVEIHNKHVRILGMGNHQDADSGRRVDVHRFVWRFFHPDDVISANDVIHHVNGNPLDNRITNLVKITREEHRRIHNNMDE